MARCARGGTCLRSAPVNERPTILVVEDQNDLAENMVEILEGFGYSAIVAPDVERGLNVARDVPLYGVILDYRLPGRDGVSFIVELRRSGCAAPVVMVSGFASADVVARARSAGALDVLSKPVDLERLVEVLRGFDRRSIDVLIVEDNPDLASDIAEALRNAGLSPEVHPSGRAATESYALPRVALIDLRLPDANGLNVARQLAARDPSVKVVVMTAHRDDLNSTLGETLDGIPCITGPVVDKPFDLAALVARLTEAARR